jgi:hypothetical protein
VTHLLERRKEKYDFLYFGFSIDAWKTEKFGFVCIDLVVYGSEDSGPLRVLGVLVLMSN